MMPVLTARTRDGWLRGAQVLELDEREVRSVGLH